MLYLAEVIQKKGGIIGGGKSELKLLACQRGEQNWSTIASEEVIPADDASRFSPGTLLLVDLTGNKQVQRVQEAGRPIASILQNFSRLQERFKTHEAEIEQWRESLTYQSQELNRREIEMEARQEQLQQLEAECTQLDAQRQEFEATRDEVLRQQQELERNREELAGAWEQLHGQKQQLEERRAELLGTCVLDEAKAQELYQLLDRLDSNASPETFQATIQQSHELVQYQQSLLTHHWQTLEHHQQTAEQMQQDVDQRSQQLSQQWQAWFQAEETLQHTKSEVKSQQAILQTQQDYARSLTAQIQHHTELHQQIQQSIGRVDNTVDEALEQMPLEQLQTIVQNMQRDFEQSSQFVHEQEEELRLKDEELEALRVKISQVSEFDRMSLEAELSDEQDAYEFLNQTLVGQRRSLKEKETTLQQHKSVLAQRQGNGANDSNLNLDSVFAQIEAQRQKQSEELQRIEAQISQLRAAIQQAQDQVNAESSEQQTKQNVLKQLEETLRSQSVAVAQLWGKVALYQELLQPIQDSVTTMQQQLDAIAQSTSQNDGQQIATAELRQAIASLTQKPEFAIV